MAEFISCLPVHRAHRRMRNTLRTEEVIAESLNT